VHRHLVVDDIKDDDDELSDYRLGGSTVVTFYDE
jgi:hypothetical protein